MITLLRPMITLLACTSVDTSVGDTAPPVDTAALALAAWEQAHGLTMVAVPPGSGTIGSPYDEVGRWIPEEYGGDGTDREVQHEVTFTHTLMVSAYEVTQGQFEETLGYNPSNFTICGLDCPVEWITWSAGAALAVTLSEAAGLSACYTCEGEGVTVACTPAISPYACDGYRYPTEAEWEYFARAGQEAAFLGGGGVVPGTEESCASGLALDNGAVIDDEAWWCGNTTSTQPVGQKPPNAWGLYDIEGNIHEWTDDWYDITWYLEPEASGEDPTGPTTGVEKVRRGGGWAYDPWRLRLAYRGWHDPNDAGDRVGARLVRLVP